MDAEPRNVAARGASYDLFTNRSSRRTLTLLGVRVLLVVVWLVSWEVAARTVIDPFNYSMPSDIWDKLVVWCRAHLAGVDLGQHRRPARGGGGSAS